MILANRLKVTLNKLIHPDQKGLVKDRFIGENIRLTYDMIKYYDINKIKGNIHNFFFKYSTLRKI